MTRKPRSPLHRASRHELAALRGVIAANLRWERHLGTPQQYLHPDEPIDALLNLSYGTIEQVRDRSRKRWQAAPHFDQSHAVYLDQHLKRYDRGAWEKKELRAEVSALRTEVGELREAIE